MYKDYTVRDEQRKRKKGKERDWGRVRRNKKKKARETEPVAVAAVCGKLIDMGRMSL